MSATTPKSKKSTLARSTGIVSAMTLLSRILGFVREIMLARQFGAGSGMDAFLVALQIPNFGRRMFAEGAFSQAFVPVFTEVKTTRSHDEARDLMAVVLGTLSGVLSLITLVGCLAAPVLVWVFASGFSADGDKAALTESLLRWTFPYLMFISLTSLAGGVLNAYGRFALPAFTPVILNLCLIAAAFIGDGGAHILAYAVFAAGILQFLAQLPALWGLKMLPPPRWAWRDARVQRIFKLMVPVLIGSSIAQVSLILNSNISTHFGDGSVSWLYYANRLMEFPLGIFSIAVGTAILPALSVQHSLSEGSQFSATLDWALRALFIIGLPAAAGMVIAAHPLVATVYGGGRFTAHDVTMTTYALWAYGAGFMGFSLVKILVPGFYARQDTKTPVRFAITGLCCGMAFSVAVLIADRTLNFAAAHVGLALSTSITAWVNALLLFFRLRRGGVYQAGAGWPAFMFKIAAATLAMALVVWAFDGLEPIWMQFASLERAGRLALMIAAAVVAYFLVLIILGVRPRDLRQVPVAKP
jgi:putative peptidoglycan lipid II flippase